MSPGVPLPDVADYLDEYLRIREIPDEPNAINGLQVENSGSIGGIVAAVDASQATIDGVIATLEPDSRRRCFWFIMVCSGMAMCRLPAAGTGGCRRSWTTTFHCMPPTTRWTFTRKSAITRCWPSDWASGWKAGSGTTVASRSERGDTARQSGDP